MSEIVVIKETLKDHEDRIRKVEQNHLEMKYNLLSIENGQKDIKIMLQENNKNQSELLNKFVDSELNLKTNNNKNGWSILFKIWAVIAPIFGGLITWIVKG